MEIQKPLNSQSNLKPQIAKAILRKKNGTLTLLVGMQTSTATMENSVEIP